MGKEVKKWEKISREIQFNKYGRVIERVDYKLPNGKITDYYIKKEGSPVCVLALTKDKMVILVKQYRPGPDDVLLELPGGGKENDEKSEEAIARELFEETGYVGDIRFVTDCFECGYSTMNRRCFVAIDCEKVGEPKPDENEFLETVLMPIEMFRKHLRSGKLTDVEVGYLGLDYLGLL